MKKVFWMLVAMVMIASGAFCADTVPVAQVTFIEWAGQNLVVIVGILLAISELMAVSPWFKGNGILDTIIKFLKYIVEKKAA